MKKTNLFGIVILTGLLSCTESDSDSPPKTSHQEIVYSISEYDIEYQNRALSVVEEMMSHHPKESYLRWRPVRIEPDEVLQNEVLSDSAMPQSLSLSLFPDTRVDAQMTRYSPIETTGGAIWTGEILGSDHSSVRISIVTATGHNAFVIEIWDPPKKYYIFPTDSPDVYVAIEGKVNPLATLD